MSQNLKYLKYKKKYIDLKDKVSKENILLGGAVCGLDGFTCEQMISVTEVEKLVESAPSTKIFKINKNKNLNYNLDIPIEKKITYEVSSSGTIINQVNINIDFFTIVKKLKDFIENIISNTKSGLIGLPVHDGEVASEEIEHFNEYINNSLDYPSSNSIFEKISDSIFKISTYKKPITVPTNIEFEDEDKDNLQSILENIFETDTGILDKFIEALKNHTNFKEKINLINSGPIIKGKGEIFSFNFMDKTFEIIFNIDQQNNINVYLFLPTDIVYELFKKKFKINIEPDKSYMKFEIDGKIFKQKKYFIENILLPADFINDLIEP